MLFAYRGGPACLQQTGILSKIKQFEAALEDLRAKAQQLPPSQENDPMFTTEEEEKASRSKQPAIMTVGNILATLTM
jgi:hypothetical protein